MFIIYSTPTCVYCDRAKTLLTSKGLEYLEFQIDQGQEKVKGNKYISTTAFKAMLPEARTVPQIYHTQGDHPQYIGGYEDLKEYLNHA